MICSKCNKEIIGVKDYGGFVVEYNKNLCKECWEKWISLKNAHNKSEQEFMK